MKERPFTVHITYILIYINAAVWLLFAVLLAFGLIGYIPSEILKWVMVVLAIGSSVVLIGIVYFLQRRNHIAYFIGLASLGVISLLSVTDEFGLLDLISLVISLAPLVLMIKDKAWYLHKSG